jgi:aryl carrier-like protein
VIHRLIEEPAESRPALMTAFLSDQLVTVLALGPTYKVDPRRSIVEIGVDSLMAMELRNRLQASLNVRVAVADLLDGPSPEQLARAVLQAMQLSSAEKSPPALEREEALL